jgi:hypothetical protein
MSIPDRSTSRQFAMRVLGSLGSTDRRVRFRLCEIVEHCAHVCSASESTAVLTSASYLQETGSALSSRDKALYSMEMATHAFAETLGDLDPALADCIVNHVSPVPAPTPEGRLMQICYKYAVTHYFDYLVLKQQVSPEGFERLQLERIDDYARLLTAHPRGSEIETRLQEVFLLKEQLAPEDAGSRWHRDLENLADLYPLAVLGHGRATPVRDR